ncbi:hypothetical protein [Acrocarpospora sp. B8E8]|uniref:hypothetical protein n=1 Tax=Acrocarpospora sp. B8E8 TaxID=3153572 RepID=UPI00325F22C9
MVVVRSTHHVPGTTSHQVVPLSIQAAGDLYRQLGDVLASATWEGINPEDLPY